MELNIRWLTIASFIFAVTLVNCYYSEHYIEDSCKLGNETIVYDTATAGFVGTIKATSHPPYKPQKHCKVIIKPAAEHGIVLSIRNVDLRPGFSNETCGDFIKIYPTNVAESPTILCRFKFDLQEKLSFFTRGPMTFIYHTELKADDKYGKETGFVFTYTMVAIDIQDCSRDNKFMCNNGLCIAEDATCDGRNNCGDRSDESVILCNVNDLKRFLQDMDIMNAFCFAIIIVLVIVAGFFIVRYGRRKTGTESPPDCDEQKAKYQVLHTAKLVTCQVHNNPNDLTFNKY